MQYIYMEIIRKSVQDFVTVHNTHRICNQRQREFYLPTGRPKELYNDPPTGVKDYGSKPVEFVLNGLLEEVKAYNLEEYLTHETKVLCFKLLSGSGFQTSYTFADDHISGYLFLRAALSNHFATNGGSISLLPKPIGAMNWIHEQKEIEQQQRAYLARFQNNTNHDFELYQTDNEDPTISLNYNKGPETQHHQDLDSTDLHSESEDSEEDDDGFVLLLPDQSTQKD